MRYLIMCGGDYHVDVPRQLWEINGEPIVKRTIRLLRENGVRDIAITSRDDRFIGFGVPVIRHKNNFGNGGNWVDGFYTDFPACHIFGDVVFSPAAIKEIVNTETDDIEFFASSPPFSASYIKSWAEPFAFKVSSPQKFRRCINTCKELARQGAFQREPIAWELWQVIKKTPLNVIDYTNYHTINDYTCDVDCRQDLMRMREVKHEEHNL